MAKYYRRRDLPSSYLHFQARIFHKMVKLLLLWRFKRLRLTGSIVVSRFNGASTSACAKYGLVQAQCFHENWEVSKFPTWTKYKYDMKLLTRLFPRNGIGSKYQRSIIKDLRPFFKGKLQNLNVFISKPVRELLNLVRGKHVKDGELEGKVRTKVFNLIYCMPCNIAFLSCSLPLLIVEISHICVCKLRT